MDRDKQNFEDTIKEYKLRLNYYSRNGIKYVLSIWTVSLLLFSISLISFLFILFPNLYHEMPIMGQWPYVLELNGNVLQGKIGNGSDQFSFAPGAIVEIGGYESTTDFNGSFHMVFASKKISNIPLLISYNNKIFIKRITFNLGQFDKNEMIILNAK